MDISEIINAIDPNENLEVVRDLLHGKDFYDLTRKLIIVHQLNLKLKLNASFTYTTIEKFLALSGKEDFGFSDQPISAAELSLFIENLTTYFSRHSMKIKLQQQNENASIDYFKSYNDDVRGDYFPEDSLNQIYSILKPIAAEIDATIGVNIELLFSFILSIRIVFFEPMFTLIENVTDGLITLEDACKFMFEHPLSYTVLHSKTELIKKIVEFSEGKLNATSAEAIWDYYSISIDAVQRNSDESLLHPIIDFHGQWLIIHWYYFPWFLQEKLEASLRIHNPIYRKYSYNKSKWLEEMTANSLISIFGEEHVTINPHYYFEDRLVESDILVEYNNTFIIVECKSCILSRKAKNGSILKLKTDVKANIGDAYEQADRLRRVLASTLMAGDLKLYNKTGKKVIGIITKKKVDDIFLVNTTCENLKMIATMLSQFKEENVYEENTDLVSFNVHDFDIISQHLSKPYEFIDYIYKRINHVKRYFVSDELDYLGMYLHDLLNRDFSDFGLVYIDDQLPYFEGYYYGKDKKDRIHLVGEYQNILDQIGALSFDHQMVMIQELLNADVDFQKKTASSFDALCSEVRLSSPKKVKMFSIPYLHRSNKKILSSFIITDSGESESDAQREITPLLEKRRATEKPEYHFLIDVNAKCKITRVRCIEIMSFRKIGRNEPCPCGSGKKYKKCCLK